MIVAKCIVVESIQGCDKSRIRVHSGKSREVIQRVLFDQKGQGLTRRHQKQMKPAHCPEITKTLCIFMPTREKNKRLYPLMYCNDKSWRRSLPKEMSQKLRIDS